MINESITAATLIAAAGEIISGTLGRALAPEEIVFESALRIGEICACAPIYGGVDGVLMTYGSRDTFRKLCSVMTGVHAESVGDDDVTDAAGELANMICGGLKLRVDMPEKFTICAPMIMRADKGAIDLLVKRNARRVGASFSDGETEIGVTLYLFRTVNYYAPPSA